LFDSSTGKSASPVLRSRSLWFHHLARSETLILVSPRLSTVYFWQKGFSDFEAVMLDGQFGGLGVNKDETILAVSSDGGTVKFIDLNSRKPVGKALHHQEDVRGIVFHPLNDRYVFTLTRGAKLFGWDRREQNVFMGPVQLLRGRNLFIDDTGKNITSKSYSGQLFRVPVQIPDEGTDYSSWLPGLAKSMIGFGISDSNTYEMYSGEVSIGGLPPEVRDWVKWLRDDSSNRSAGPTVNVKVSQLIEDLSDSTNLYQLRQALRLRPNNPEVLSQFAYQLVANAGPSDDPEIQARFISAKARELGGNKAVVFYRSAQIEKVLNNQADALKYIDRAVELDSGSVEYLEFRKTLLDNN
jgi:WD40 repeat protein